MAKAWFRTQWNKGEEVFSSPTGAKTEFRHTAHMDKEGHRFLIPDKEIAIYELIQASKDSVDIKLIVRRYLEGDNSALSQIQGQYMDISDAPKSLAQAQQLIMNSKEEFAKLPIEIKRQFNMNPEEYVAQVGTKEWYDKLGITAELEKREAARKAKEEYELNMQMAAANLAAGGTKIGGEEE